MSKSLPINKNNGSVLPIIIVLLFCLVIMGVLCVRTSSSSYSIFNRTWGFDNLMFYGTEVRLFTLLLLLGMLIPPVNSKIPEIILWSSDLLSTRVNRHLLAIFWACVSFLLFYYSQVKFHFLGDMHLRMEQTMRKEFVNTEYLTMFGLHHLAVLVGKAGVSAETFFRVYSCVAGCLYVYFASLLSNEAAKEIIGKVICFLSIVSTSALLLFCGYVEIYATPALLLTIYLYACFRYLNKKASLIFPILVLVAAILSHLICAAAIPSLLVCFYWNNRTKFRLISKTPNKYLALGIVLLVLLGLLLVFKSGSSFVLPLNKNGTRFSFLSFKHLWEFTNGQILCSGLNLFVVIIVLIRAAVEKIRLLSTHYFLIIFSGGLLLLILISDLQRGSGDWDIMAFPSFSLNLLSTLLCLNLLGNKGRFLAVFLWMFNLINAILWINIHHSDKTIPKLESMLINDPASYYQARMTGKVQVAVLYKVNRLYNDAKRISLEACMQPGIWDPRACLLYVECLQKNNEEIEAVSFCEWLLSSKSPYIYEAYLVLLQYYYKIGKHEKVKFYLNMIYDSFMRDPYSFFNNSNFKPKVLAETFDALYKYESKSTDTLRLSKIKYNAEQLRNAKKRGEK